MRKTCTLVAAAVLVLAIALLPHRVGLWLLFGWLLFPLEVLPSVTVHWPGVAAGVAAVALFTAGVQWAGRTWAPAWRLRWSLVLVAGLFLLFLAGTAMIAVLHQAAWLATSPEPLVGSVHARARPSTDNLKTIGIGTSNYPDVYGGAFPMGGTFGPDGTMLHSWETQILFVLSYSTHRIDHKLPWNHPNNAAHFKSVIPEFINGRLVGADLRDAEGYGLSHYAANVRVMGANRGMKLADITDGLATTLLVGEVNARFRPWGHPVNYRDPAKGINRSPQGFGGAPRAGGAHFAMADGSVRFVSERINPAVLEALATPDGGETVDTAALGWSGPALDPARRSGP